MYNILAVVQFENLNPEFGKRCFSPCQAAQPKAESKGECPRGAAGVWSGLASLDVPRVRPEGSDRSVSAVTGLLKDITGGSSYSTSTHGGHVPIRLRLPDFLMYQEKLDMQVFVCS